VALYQGLNTLIENQMQIGFHDSYLKDDANGKIKAITYNKERVFNESKHN